MQGILYEAPSFIPFFIISCVFGGGLAWLSGRGCALTWRSIWGALVYMLPLGYVVRFLHYIMPPYYGILNSFHYYMIDTIVLIILCALGYRYTRVQQMIRQYGWLYQRTSPLTFKKKTNAVS